MSEDKMYEVLAAYDWTGTAAYGLRDPATDTWTVRMWNEPPYPGPSKLLRIRCNETGHEEII